MAAVWRCQHAADPRRTAVGATQCHWPERTSFSGSNASRSCSGLLCSNLERSRRPQGRRIVLQRSAQQTGPSLGIKQEFEDLTPADAEVVPLNKPADLTASGPFSQMTVLVAGATGGTGKAIVSRLVAEAARVRALVRDVISAARILPGTDSGVELFQGDVFQFDTLPSALDGCDAAIIATGFSSRLDPFGPYNVDYQGTANIVSAAKLKGVKTVVLVSSIGVDDPFFPLNLLFGVLFWKKRAEEELQRSGLTYTIVRPGGLLNEPRQGQRVGGVVMAKPNTYGLPPKQIPGILLRKQVADVCVEALVTPQAANKVVEVVADDRAPAIPIASLFKYI